MNKKILSLAIAAAVAAPMAVQADVKISGSVQRSLTSTSGTLGGGDNGTSKLNIDASEGDAFLRMAWDIRQNYGAPSDLDGTATGTTTALVPLVQREQFAGIKIGGGKLMVGRQANLASKIIYGADTMNATFLEARKKSGGTDTVASFDSGMIGYSMKAGDVNFGLAYGPAYKDAGAASNPINANASFKAGSATVAIGYDQNSSSATTTAISAKMKFGGVSVNGLYEVAPTANIIFVDASMAMGGGSLGVGIGSDTTASATYTRVSFTKKMGKAKVFAGVSNVAAGSTVGAGLRVDM